MAAKTTKSVRKKTKKPLIVKLSPNYHDIPLMAKTVVDSGADAISLINTITGMAIDAEKKRPILANVVGGLSGPAIKPVALRMVWQAYNAVKKDKIPIIGMGGIMSVTDVVEFLLAGSTAIQIGTGNFVRPNIAVEIIEGLGKYLQEHNISDIGRLTGGLIL
jgi:dihydroorotate dehydrogenase (NAD+) catalytic subunit